MTRPNVKSDLRLKLSSRKMHELFSQVLKDRDLSRAGDLFSVSDSSIINDLTDVINEITAISSQPNYCQNDNDQSVVEICVTRVTSCIRETGSVEKHCTALVALLESCLHHNLQPEHRDEDPPHAKIAADIISCIFLASDNQNYSKKAVMEAALPVAVKFLHKGNKELSRNMARYLSLAAIHHANLLQPHVQPIMDSIISGNYPLCRVLCQLYEVSPGPLNGHAMALVSLLPHTDQQEKLALLSLFELMAKNDPSILEASISQLVAYLCPNTASPTAPNCVCAGVLKVLLCVSEGRPQLLVEHLPTLHRASLPPHATSHIITLIAQILAQVGKLSKERAQEALNFVLEQMGGCERWSHAALLREATALCRMHPALFTDKVLHGVRIRNNNAANEVKQTPGGVTIVKLGGAAPPPTPAAPPPGSVPPPPQPPGGYTRRAKLGDSRSTGRLHTSTNTHRSMTRLNIAGGSVGGLHKSMTRLSSSQQINQQPSQTAARWSAATPARPAVTVTTVSPLRAPRTTGGGNHVRGTVQPSSGQSIFVGANSNPGPTLLSNTSSAVQSQLISVNPLTTGKSSDSILPIPVITSSVSIQHSNTALGNVSVINPAPNSMSASPSGAPITQNLGSGPILIGSNANPISISGPVTVTSRRPNNTSVTMINSDANQSHRISVFEPYPMRDTVQHFCEKHLDKIKAYMDNVSLRLPPPAKCTIEERRAKKMAKLHFACQSRGQHCLYSRTFFTMRTRNPRIWIHLMFLALQARSASALSSRESSVSSLKHCWDILKCENKTFLTLVTSAFPCMKDQEMLLNELRQAGFFDVFELNTSNGGGEAAQWGCFLCNHPERAIGFLSGNTQPVIEGQLKEKKGRWRLFRRWRTRYFTLSGAHLSCKGSSGGESIDINQIRSVKVSRGARNIPKAFEIFTGDQTLILKPKDGKNAEEWVQCLSIVVAHSQARDAPAKSNSLPARGVTLKNL